MTSPRRYTADEDKIIIEKVEQAANEGRNVTGAFEELAKILDRTAVALNFRYYNVIRKKIDTGEQIAFLDEDNRANYVAWTPEQDERLLEAVEIAESEGIPTSVVFMKFGDDTDRSDKSVAAHYYALRKKLRGGDDGDDDGEESDGKGVLNKLKTLVKERDMYKQKFEALKKETEYKLSQYDKMARELRQIRKFLD